MDTEIRLLKEKINNLERENAILRQQQIEITAAKELYLKIFDDFPALIWRSRLDKLCDYFNKTWFDFTGRTVEQEFGNGWAEGVHPDDFVFCLKTYVESFDKKQAFSMDYRLKNKFGEYRWIRDFGRPFYDLDNTFLGYIGSCYDITEKIEDQQKLIELNATKDKFISIIAHDLKTPLNSIVGFSEILVERVADKKYEDADEFAKIILDSANRTIGLIVNLLEWAQSQSGRMEFNPEYFEIDKIIDEAILLMKGNAGQKSITIENVVQPYIKVFADQAMIKTVIRNLISNAIKFTQPGGKITIVAYVSLDMFSISIRDNGVGIPEDKINKIFNIDESFSTQGTQNERGTGLGLILCKEFVKKNNGKIWVESKVGKGSAFYFSLPLNDGNV